MRRALLAALCLATLALPTAAALGSEPCIVDDGRTAVCAYDESIHDGTCETQNGGSEFDATTLHVRSDDARTAVTVFGAAS